MRRYKYRDVSFLCPVWLTVSGARLPVSAFEFVDVYWFRVL